MNRFLSSVIPDSLGPTPAVTYWTVAHGTYPSFGFGNVCLAHRRLFYYTEENMMEAAQTWVWLKHISTMNKTLLKKKIEYKSRYCLVTLGKNKDAAAVKFPSLGFIKHLTYLSKQSRSSDQYGDRLLLNREALWWTFSAIKCVVGLFGKASGLSWASPWKWHHYCLIAVQLPQDCLFWQ